MAQALRCPLGRLRRRYKRFSACGEAFLLCVQERAPVGVFGACQRQRTERSSRTGSGNDKGKVGHCVRELPERLE